MALMQSYEVIIVGSGITGAALGYELASLGVRVLILEQDLKAPSATRYSYGGISYWAGTPTLTQSLCADSLAIHRQLSDRLEAPTEFRELPLLGLIEPNQDPEAIFKTFQDFTVSPQLLTPKEAQTLEPLLNPDGFESAVLMPYAHINPSQTVEAYVQAMLRLGGSRLPDTVVKLMATDGGVQVQGKQGLYHCDRAIVCAGGAARALLAASGLTLRQYFSHAESIETDRCNLQMQTVVMPATIRRFDLEKAAAIDDQAWSDPEPNSQELLPPVLDCGALQFKDSSLRFGQISRAQTHLRSQVSPAESEAWMRDQIARILPQIAQVPGRWVTCTVAFSQDHLPLVGPVDPEGKIQVLSGFSNPMALVPATAQRFAQQLVSGQVHESLTPFLPSRFV